jgi:hypothetical protein
MTTFFLCMAAFVAGIGIGAWSGGRDAARERTMRFVELGHCRKLCADRLKAAANSMRHAAEDLWPASWNDEPPHDQPDEPRGYE